jgi:hypothetical protein
MMSPKMSMIVIKRLLMVKIDDNFKKVINEVEFDSTNNFLSGKTCILLHPTMHTYLFLNSIDFKFMSTLFLCNKIHIENNYL